MNNTKTEDCDVKPNNRTINMGVGGKKKKKKKKKKKNRIKYLLLLLWLLSSFSLFKYT